MPKISIIVIEKHLKDIEISLEQLICQWQNCLKGTNLIGLKKIIDQE